jgi:hypothetical protein
MLSRLIEQKEALEQFAFDKRDYSLTLAKGDWDLAIEICKLLKPADDATKLLMKTSLSGLRI